MGKRQTYKQRETDKQRDREKGDIATERWRERERHTNKEGEKDRQTQRQSSKNGERYKELERVRDIATQRQTD
jgi:hypothetical protein